MNTVFAVQAVMSLVDNITGPLRAVRGGMDTTERQAGSLAGKMGNLAKVMLPIAVAAGIVLAAFAPGISTAANFQAAISQVGAVSRAVPADLQLLEQAALDLGASTAWSASEVAAAEKYLAMAGFSVKDNIAALPGVLNLASAAQEDLGNTADIASGILAAFKMEAGRTGEVADILTATFTSSKTTLSGLGSTMANVAPIAAAAGASLSDVAAMAGKLGDCNIDASVAGTGIKIMFQRLQGPTGAAAQTLEDLGIKTKDAAGNMLPIFDILGNLQAATAAMGSADKASILKQIFGDEAVGSVTALMGTGIATIREYAGTLADSGGIASDVADDQLANLNGAVTILGSAWEGLQISIGKVFLPVLTPLVQGISTVVGWLRILANTSVGKAFISIVAAVAVAVIAVTAFAGASALAATVLPFVTGALATAGAAFAAVSWPVWLIIAVLGVLYVAWRKNLGGMADIISGWWNKISLVFQGVRAVFATLNGATGMIEGELAKEINAAGLVGLVTTVAKVVFRIKEFFAGLWDAVSFGVSGVLDIFKPVVSSLTSAFKPLFTIISYVSEALFGITASTDVSGWRTLGEVVGTVVGAAFRMLAWAVRIAITPLKWTADIIGFLLSCFIGLGKGIGWVAGWISVKLEALPALVGNIADGVSRTFDLMLAGIKWAFMNLTPLGWMIQAFSGIKGFLDGIDLSECGAKLMGTFVAGIKSMIMAPVNLVKSGLQAIRNLLPFSDAKEGPLSALTASGRALMDTLGAGVRGSAPGLAKTVKGAMVGVATAMAVAAPAQAMPPVDPLQPPVMADVRTPDIPEIQTPVLSEIAAPAVQDIQAPEIPEVQAPNVADIQVPKIESPALLDVQSRIVQPEMPGIAPLDIQSKLSQPKIPGVDPLNIQPEVSQPRVPGVDPLVTSMAVEGMELPQVPQLTASMAPSVTPPAIPDLHGQAIWQTQPVTAPGIDDLDMPDIKPPVLSEIAAPAVANIPAPEIESPALLDVQSRVAQPEMPGADLLNIQSKVEQPEIPGIDPLNIQPEVSQPRVPGVDPLVTSMAVEGMELPQVPQLTASMAPSVTPPAIPDLHGQAIWQTQPVTTPGIDAPDMPELQALRIPGVEVPNMGGVELPDLSKIQGSDVNFESPVNSFSDKPQKAQAPEAGSADDVNPDRQVIIQNLTVTLTGVQNAETFVEQLKRLVDGYDG